MKVLVGVLSSMELGEGPVFLMQCGSEGLESQAGEL